MFKVAFSLRHSELQAFRATPFRQVCRVTLLLQAFRATSFSQVCRVILPLIGVQSHFLILSVQSHPFPIGIQSHHFRLGVQSHPSLRRHLQSSHQLGVQSHSSPHMHLESQVFNAIGVQSCRRSKLSYRLGEQSHPSPHKRSESQAIKVVGTQSRRHSKSQAFRATPFGQVCRVTLPIIGVQSHPINYVQSHPVLHRHSNPQAFKATTFSLRHSKPFLLISVQSCTHLEPPLSNRLAESPFFSQAFRAIGVQSHPINQVYRVTILLIGIQSRKRSESQAFRAFPLVESVESSFPSQAFKAIDIQSHPFQIGVQSQPSSHRH